MNNPNPLLPQGSLNSQSKGKSNFRIAVFTILGIHVVLICGFLIFGCKPEPVQPEATTEVEPTNQAPETFDSFGSSETAANPFPDTNGFPPYDPAPGIVSTGAPVTTGGVPTGGVSSVTPATPTNLAPSIPTPEPPPLVAPTPSGETTVHVIAKGDILSELSKKYKVSVKAIEDANPGVNPTRLQIGQKLIIPAPAATPSTATSTTAVETGNGYTTYTVKSGDVLERIAKDHKTTINAIKSANGLKTDRIYAGQKLKIPSAQ